MAERLGPDLQRLLRLAEAKTELAIFFALDCLNTFLFRSIASLCLVTSDDHFFFFVFIIKESIRCP